MNHPQNELKVYLAIATGELEIEDGKIWRVKKRTWDRWRKETRLTPCKKVRAEMLNGLGYLQVRIMRDLKRVHAAAHRLVWLYHKGTIPQGMTVNHKNGDKTDNRLANLELATQSEQRIHACRVLNCGRNRPQGEKHPKTKLTNKDVLEMRALRARGVMVKDIAKQFGMTKKATSFITTGRTWKHLPLGSVAG